MVAGIAPLNRKLLRDLWRLRAQGLAIAMVVGSGVALLVMALTTVEALEETTNAYYERYRFPDVFSDVKRAPQRLESKIGAIAGVQAVETRIVHLATLDIAGFAEPVTGKFVSLPDHGQPRLNRLYLRAGRLPDPGRSDEAVISEPFAEAHDLHPGGKLAAVLNGRKRDLTIVGIALSPEFVYAIAPGGLVPDDKRFGIVWMGRDAMEAAFDMKEAFNNVSVTLLRGVDPRRIVDQLDLILADYGGIGAYDRSDHISNWFLQNEITQQKSMAGILPAIFLLVAIFLTSMVMSRLVATERGEIGLLKAFGYSNAAIGWHYTKLSLCVAVLGIAIGFVAGSWLGHFNTALYGELYRFPFLLYRPSGESYLIAGVASLAAAIFGCLGSVRRAVRLPPAEAMRPPAPPVYRRSRLSIAALARWLDEPSRMIVRRTIRWPVQFLLSATGVALSLAVLFLALQWLDSIDFLIDDFFERSQHQDATIALVEPERARVTHDLAQLPGVMAVETLRSVPARISHGAVSRRQSLIGIPYGQTIQPAHDAKRGPVDPPPAGLLLSSKMAEILGVRPGDTVNVEILEGIRPHVVMTVADTIESYIETPVYIHIDKLNRLMRDPDLINVAQLRIDTAKKAAFLDTLKKTPRVSAVTFRTSASEMFRNTVAETIYIFVGFFTVFACTLAFGVLYNTLRIALAERSRELATLRVLGFSRGEISYILLGEAGLIVAAAIPLGIAFGVGLAWYISAQFDTELYRVPLVVKHATLGVSSVTILATVAVCAGIVRRRVDHLDLIAVLKTRE